MNLFVYFYFLSLNDLQALSAANTENGPHHFLHNDLISKLAASIAEEKLENQKQG